MHRQPQLYDQNVGNTICECPATAGLFRLSEFNLGRRWGWLIRRAVLGTTVTDFTAAPDLAQIVLVLLR